MLLIRNSIGFLECETKPSTQQLSDYYNNKYYAKKTAQNQYRHEYTQQEIEHKKIEAQEILNYISFDSSSVIELGCGEGFILNDFDKLGWNITGADFTVEGINQYFPHLIERIHIGDLFKTIDKLCLEKKRYDLVICNNVLEHVIEPIKLLEKAKTLLSDRGLLRISVPNDDSLLQYEAVRQGYAEDTFWGFYPEHLNYFNAETFRKVLEYSGFRVIDILSSFPIDMFIFNQDSNYQKERSKGRNCHQARVVIENAIAQQSIDKLIKFKRGCAEAGIGRNLTAYCVAN